MNAKLPSSLTAQDILNQLTLEEKVALVGAADWWRTEAIRRGDELLVPHIKVSPSSTPVLCRPVH
jgi:beta-glucosidase